jgi:hypothetical protein
MIYRDDLGIIKVPKSVNDGLFEGEQVEIKYNTDWNLKPKDIIEWDSGIDAGTANVVKAGGRICIIQNRD